MPILPVVTKHCCNRIAISSTWLVEFFCAKDDILSLAYHPCHITC